MFLAMFLYNIKSKIKMQKAKCNSKRKIIIKQLKAQNHNLKLFCEKIFNFQFLIFNQFSMFKFSILKFLVGQTNV
mgnify:CR=1 FL=1